MSFIAKVTYDIIVTCLLMGIFIYTTDINIPSMIYAFFGCLAGVVIFHKNKGDYL